MTVLGIESSCDETAAAVVSSGRTLRVLSSVVASQHRLLGVFGGVVPELASRRHVQAAVPVIEQAVRRAGGWSGVDALAVTRGPGLPGSLLIGTLTARTLAWARDLPCYGVNHVEAHLLSILLVPRPPAFPFVGLVASGGHTDLVVVDGIGRYRCLGRTRDDAAGEAFDKVAALLGLGYPGGPQIDRLAARGRADAVNLPRPHLPGSWDFSFSGLKTAVGRLVGAVPFGPPGGNDGRHGFPLTTAGMTAGMTAGARVRRVDMAAAFQRSVVEVLAAKVLRACREFRIRRAVVGGGVAANRELRATLVREGRKAGVQVWIPARRLCTDNAAMIAAVGALLVRCGAEPGRLTVEPELEVASWR